MDREPPPSRLSATVIVDGPRRPRLRAASLARWIERHAPRRAAGTVTVALVGDARMRALNRRFRGVNRATDVLSFPAEGPGTTVGGARRPRRSRRGAPRTRGRRTPAAAPGPAPHLGDLAIAVGVAARQARAEGHALATELRVLALHGLLHLLGYDHERDLGRMRTLEERLRRQAGLPAGLISRSPAGATDR